MSRLNFPLSPTAAKEVTAEAAVDTEEADRPQGEADTAAATGVAAAEGQ